MFLRELSWFCSSTILFSTSVFPDNSFLKPGIPTGTPCSDKKLSVFAIKASASLTRFANSGLRGEGFALCNFKRLSSKGFASGGSLSDFISDMGRDLSEEIFCCIVGCGNLFLLSVRSSAL